MVAARRRMRVRMCFMVFLGLGLLFLEIINEVSPGNGFPDINGLWRFMTFVVFYVGFLFLKIVFLLCHERNVMCTILYFDGRNSYEGGTSLFN